MFPLPTMKQLESIANDGCRLRHCEKCNLREVCEGVHQGRYIAKGILWDRAQPRPIWKNPFLVELEELEKKLFTEKDSELRHIRIKLLNRIRDMYINSTDYSIAKEQIKKTCDKP